LFTKTPAHEWQTINHKYLKQIAVDYPSHLTIKNNLKVKKRYIISKTSTTFPAPKKTLGVRVETNIPKNSKAIIMLALCSGRCLFHHKGIENDHIIFFHVTAVNMKFAVESMTKFSFIQFFVGNTTLSR